MSSTPFTAGIAATLVAGLGVVFGYLLVRAVRPRTRGPLAWALAVPALLTFVLALMVVHIVTRGAVLSEPWFVRALTLGAAGLGVARIYPNRGHRERTDLWIAGGLLLLALALWSAPVFSTLPIDFRGDLRLHLGWAAQLINGESTPTAPITGEVPNYYPWLFHSVLAFLSHFTPGGRPVNALAPLHLIGVSGSVLAFYALGRALAGRLTGAMAALFGALGGGLGYFAARRIDFVLRPRDDGGDAAMTYFGDLLHHKSYNFAFNNLSPPFPRDLTLALLPAFLLLLALGIKRRHRPSLVGAGAVLGLIGLTHLDTMMVGLATALIAALFSKGIVRLTLTTAFGVWAVWLVPTVYNYVRLGGFVDLSLEPVTLPLVGIVVGWGMALLLAPFGARWLARSDTRVVVAMLIAATVVLVVATFVPRVLGEGFTTIGHAHRYWPLLYAAVALVGALGAGHVVGRLAARHRWLGIAAGSVIALLAVPSPLIGSVAAAREMAELNREVPIDQRTATGEPDALPNLVAPEPGPCTLAASPKLSARLFSYSGYRLVVYARNHEAVLDARGTGGNLAYIRWADIYDHIAPEAERLAANEILIQEPDDPLAWREAAARFGVDVVVVPADLADHVTFDGYDVQISEPHLGERFAVVRLTDCGT